MQVHINFSSEKKTSEGSEQNTITARAVAKSKGIMFCVAWQLHDTAGVASHLVTIPDQTYNLKTWSNIYTSHDNMGILLKIPSDQLILAKLGNFVIHSKPFGHGRSSADFSFSQMLITVPPDEHHVCSDWQKENIDVLHHRNFVENPPSTRGFLLQRASNAYSSRVYSYWISCNYHSIHTPQPSYHIISYHIIYHIISYIMEWSGMEWNISYHIVSYHIISYHIMEWNGME